MSKRQTLMLLGAITMILLFLGFPLVWKQIFAVLIGGLIIGISYTLGPKEQKPAADAGAALPFVEHRAARPVEPGEPVQPPEPATGAIDPILNP